MNMSTRLYLLAALVTLFPFTVAENYSTTSTDIIKDVKSLLAREASKLSENTTNGPLIPSDDIVNQILSLLNCGPFTHAPNSHLEYSVNYTTHTLRSYQTCDRYFKTSQNTDSLQVQCKYKNWFFNKIQCERTTCPRLTPPTGGHISTTVNTYNTTVYFWCSRGLAINGTDKLFCKENGVWNLQQPTCHLSLCRALASPWHGFVSNQKDTPVNQTVAFTCESEYTLIGDAVLRCDENGRWNTSAPVCKKTCIVSNDEVQFKDIRLIPSLQRLSIGVVVQQGQRVAFSCKSGSALSSNGISKCIGQTWKPPIQCKPSCTVVEIVNGIYALSKDHSTVEYSCSIGYQLVGQRKLTCLPNITWDSEVPVCSRTCTVSKLPTVLSYRNKTTYEIIPFGSQVANGTQMIEVCGMNSSQANVRECDNGEISPSSCKDPRARMASSFELFFDQQWMPICSSDHDICGLFGYSKTLMQGPYCYQCSTLDVEEYLKTSRIVLNPTRISQYCTMCWLK